ncbi:hypothetical protein L6R46_08330 [Myxococcota bacterium]|nr:hypothetical protein [Myxococcota bacterium]
MTHLRRAALIASLIPLIAAWSGPAHAGAFVSLEWRGYAMAEHLSHGPAFAAGASLWDDHLRIGLAGTARPGPMNPHTFNFDVPSGDYKGQETLQLRSDGAVTGLTVSPGLDVADGRLHLELPMMLGYGGYGFYLHGEDRVTPDGRKPSAWENELLAEADSAFGVAANVGLRASWAGTALVRPTAGLQTQTVLGYEATMAPRYAGLALSLGVDVVLPGS